MYMYYEKKWSQNRSLGYTANDIKVRCFYRTRLYKLLSFWKEASKLIEANVFCTVWTHFFKNIFSNYVFMSLSTDQMTYLIYKDQKLYFFLVFRLTYYSPALFVYTPYKHQKSYSFSNVFRGYREATPGYNGLLFYSLL